MVTWVTVAFLSDALAFFLWPLINTTLFHRTAAHWLVSFGTFSVNSRDRSVGKSLKLQQAVLIVSGLFLNGWSCCSVGWLGSCTNKQLNRCTYQSGWWVYMVLYYILDGGDTFSVCKNILYQFSFLHVLLGKTEVLYKRQVPLLMQK